MFVSEELLDRWAGQAHDTPAEDACWRYRCQDLIAEVRHLRAAHAAAVRDLAMMQATPTRALPRCPHSDGDCHVCGMSDRPTEVKP